MIDLSCPDRRLLVIAPRPAGLCTAS